MFKLDWNWERVNGFITLKYDANHAAAKKAHPTGFTVFEMLYVIGQKAKNIPAPATWSS